MSSHTVTAAAASLRATVQTLQGQFVERDAEVQGIMLALIAGEHVFLGGPPGTAKSALINAFAKASGGKLFTRLLMRQSVPDELFGPIDLLALKEGRHERKIDGYLPDAEFAFLDECFKANSAILNGLLTLMNERAYDHGNTRIGVPLKVLAGASNELPEDDSLAALWDRFLVRFWVNGIADEDAWEELILNGAEPGEGVTLDSEALEVLRAAVDSVKLKPAMVALRAIRTELASQLGIEPSDRRWRKIAKLVKAHALLHGRTEATPADLKVLSFSVWEDPDARNAVSGIVASLSNPQLTAAMQFHDAARDAIEGLDTSSPDPDEVKKVATARRTLGAIIEAMETKLDEFSARDEDADLLLEEVKGIRKTLIAEARRALRS